jgi:hypothetical protein
VNVHDASSIAVPFTRSFWSVQLVVALVLNVALNALQIGAYAARLAGVRTGRVGTSISLFNLFVTASRFANMFYAPMLGSISDAAGKAVRVPGLADAVVAQYTWQMRAIVFAATAGSLVGAVLLPTFSMLFVRAVAAFERYGSLPRAIARGANPRVFGEIVRSLRPPPFDLPRRFRLADVPRKLLVGNVIVTGIYAAGVVASYLASVIRPDVARTALSASGLVNGIATIAFTLVVDPTSALIVDKAVKGEKSLHDVKTMVVYLAATAVIGTLAAQLILWPAALFIAGVAHLINVPR